MPDLRQIVGVSIRSRRLSAGECEARAEHRLAGGVSIRSRRLSAGESRAIAPTSLRPKFQSAPADCRRENPSNHAAGRGRNVSIRSRRLSAGEWPPNVADLTELLAFQSAPADCRRENVALRRKATEQTDVSIRSRRLSAGECGTRRWITTKMQFQSAPADCRRENADERDLTWADSRFQSAPADCRRENSASQHATILRWFQSAPADCRRENDARAGGQGRKPVVSIRSRRLSAGESPRGPIQLPASTVSIRSRRLSAGE